jgi:hypothetical protein
MDGVNSTMIYCKNSCKCHNVPQHIIIIKMGGDLLKKRPDGEDSWSERPEYEG